MLLNQKYEIFPTEAQIEVLDRWLQFCLARQRTEI